MIDTAKNMFVLVETRNYCCPSNIPLPSSSLPSTSLLLSLPSALPSLSLSSSMTSSPPAFHNPNLLLTALLSLPSNQYGPTFVVYLGQKEITQL